MFENTYRKTIAIIKPEDAKDLGIIKNYTSEIIVNDVPVEVVWPRTNRLSKILSSVALKNDLMLKTEEDPNAKKYYKPCSNRENNFRRIIDLEIINGSKTTNHIKLNDLKMHQTDYQSSFILKSDKTISDLNQQHIEEKFNNFFDIQEPEISQQPTQEVQEEIFDMNPIRKMSLDYKTFGDQFLELYEITPEDQLKVLFNDVNTKLIGLDGLSYIEVMYKNNDGNND